ncbi:hypothetical protein ACWGOQ_0015745 [Aquimarina sp. M1]
MKTRNFTITKQVIKEKREPKVPKFGGKVILGNIADLCVENIVISVNQFFIEKMRVSILNFLFTKKTLWWEA